MSVNMIAASRRVSACPVLLGSFFIGPDYPASAAELSTVRANYRENTPRCGCTVSVFSSPSMGEDTGEGERRNYPLSLALSHKGRENPRTKRSGWLRHIL